MIFRATFGDGDQVRVSADDEATAHRRVRQLYGPGIFTLEAEKSEDVQEVLPPRRPRALR